MKKIDKVAVVLAHGKKSKEKLKLSGIKPRYFPYNVGTGEHEEGEVEEPNESASDEAAEP